MVFVLFVFFGFFSPHLLIICALYYYTEAFLFSPVLSLIRLQQLQRGVPHLSRHSAFSAKFTSCNLRVK